MRIEINPRHPEPRKIRKAAEALRQGAVLAYPTDTIYGVACALGEKKAMERICQMTGKSRGHPMTLICPDLSDIARYAVVENSAYRIMKRVLPGPYCFVLPATREVPRILMKKRKTIGLRVPDSPVALALVRELGTPLISTSAKWQGEEALNDPADIVARFKGLEMVLDAGYGGLEPSTMLDLSVDPLEVIREGAGPLEAVLG